MNDTKPVIPRKSLAFFKILNIFLEGPNREYTGAEIMNTTKLKSGTTYPLLARMVTNHWLKAKWEKIDPNTSGRPPKRLYSLTKRGHTEALKIVHEEFPTFWKNHPKTPATQPV